MRRFFREILSLCLVLAMLTVGCMAGLCEEATASAEETKAIAFEPTITNGFDYSASEWFSSGFNRAMLAVILSLDLCNIVDKDVIDFGPALTESSFVAKDGLILVVYYHGTQDDLYITYMPLTGQATYQITDKSEDYVVQYALETVVDDGCYKNDFEDLMNVVALLKDATADS